MRLCTSGALGDSTPIAALFAMLNEQGIRIDEVGHRLIYGGLEHEAPARVTPDLLTSLDLLVWVDPLHLPNALAAIREVEAALPAVVQVVCFDTAFHRRMPMVAQRLPLPQSYALAAANSCLGVRGRYNRATLARPRALRTRNSQHRMDRGIGLRRHYRPLGYNYWLQSEACSLARMILWGPTP